MFCTKCGQKIPSGAAFCPNCGAKVQTEEPARPSAAPSEAAVKAESAQPAPEPAAQTGPAPSASESAAQPEAAPSAGPSMTPPAPQPTPDGPQPAGDPLAVMVGKHADYYLAEFKKIDAGQKPRFNWAAFLLGEAMCFYRYNVELFKKYFMLYYILLAVPCMIQSVSMAATAGGGVMIGLIGSVVYLILALVVSILSLVMRIRFGKNFNRAYYNYCKQQMALPASQRKVGTSAKKMWLFVLVVAVIWGVWYAGTTLITQQVQKAYWGSFWDDSSYSEDADVESSSYYDETYDEADSYVEEEPAVSAEETPSFEVGSMEMLENAWATFLAGSGEEAITTWPIMDDCDDDGLYEAFAATAEEHDEDMDIYFGAKIYFIDSYGNVTLLCDTAPEGGPLYGKPNNLGLLLSPDNIYDFFVWDVYAGTSAPSLVWGVLDGQVYESNISGQYCSVHWADGPGLAGYQFDYSKGYRDYIVYRLNYDRNTASFTAVPDSTAYPDGESPI